MNEVSKKNFNKNCFLVLISVAFAPYSNQPCTYRDGRTGPCHVQYSALRFTGPVLRATIKNTYNSPIMGGNLVLKPEGYGCILFFCAWQPGSELNDPTCTWPGMACSGENLIAAGESKTVEMDFTEALVEAGGTSGCCSNDGCCNLRGTAIHTNPQDGEYAKIFMSFSCTFKAPYLYTVSQFEEDEERNPIVVEENLIDE